MDIGILCRGLLYLPEHLRPFGIVVGAAAGEHQLAVAVPPDHPVGLDHAQGVLEPVEARNLGQDGALRVDPEPLQHPADDLRLQIPVLVAQRIDRGGDPVLGNRHVPGEIGHRKHGGVVPLHPGPQKFPDGGVRVGHVDMAAPDPLAPDGRLLFDEARGLGVVDEQDVPLELHLLEVHRRVFPKDLQHLGRDRFGMPVKRVMEGLGHGVERLVPLDDVPGGVHAQFPQERDHAGEDLRHPAPHGG